jgi:hypothetical protein
MKKIILVLAILLCAATSALATPSTTYWTPMVMDFQGFMVPHIGIDNYFTADKTLESGQQGAFPADLGLTVGVMASDKIQMEVGIDALYPSDNPYYFNAKIGVSEDVIFQGAPALEAGVFNVGTKDYVTNQDIGYIVIGKTIPYVGRVSVGPYLGNSAVLVDDQGVVANAGVMVAFDHGFVPAKDADGSQYNKWVLAGDWASGNNALGGGGFGLYYFFTGKICLLVGPVWFNNSAINGSWKWTTQLDINL